VYTHVSAQNPAQMLELPIHS